MVQLLIHVKNIRHLQKKSPTKNGWSKNPPNSPDLAYTIEDLWVLLNLELKEGIQHH